MDPIEYSLMFYAHSAPTREAWEPLADHLRDVAERAASFASPFGAADEARLAGRALFKERGADSMDLQDPDVFDLYYHRL